MRIIISGSSGLIGSGLLARLAEEGHDVLGLRRGAPGSAPVVWQPDEGWIQDGALEGCDAVVHLAGASIGEGRWSVRRKRELRSSRVDATRLLVEHIASLERKPRVLISASAVGYYGDRGDEVLDEDAGPGEGFLAGLCTEWEQEALRAEEAGVRTVLLRFGVVISRRGGALPRMLFPFRLGLGGRLGSGGQWMPWVSLEDALRAIEWAIETEIAGPVNVTAPDAVTNAQFTRALARQMHRPAFFRVPRLALRIALGQSADELLMWSARATPARLLESGFEFRHPDIASGLVAAFDGGV